MRINTAVLSVLVIISLAYVEAPGAQEKTLFLPPDSLADWYKPKNKRQVWLHTMFSLRREMQAVSEYVEMQNQPLVKKWSDRLIKHYFAISDMVPEWKNELSPEWAAKLGETAQAGDFAGVAKALRKIGNTCKACHREYRAVTAALYRTPDYKVLRIPVGNSGQEQEFPELMNTLSALVNRIKIASEDGRKDSALDALGSFSSRLDDLETICSGCHTDEAARSRIFGENTRKTLNELEQSLHAEDRKNTGKYLGTAAVIVCARCHGVHRTLGDLTELIGRVRN